MSKQTFIWTSFPLKRPKEAHHSMRRKSKLLSVPYFWMTATEVLSWSPHVVSAYYVLSGLLLMFPPMDKKKNIIGHHIECYGNHLLTKIYATGHFSVANNVNYRYQWRGSLRSFNEFPCITALKSVLHQKALGVTINWCSYMHQIVCYFRDSVLTIRGVYLLEFNFRNSEGSPELF